MVRQENDLTAALTKIFSTEDTILVSYNLSIRNDPYNYGGIMISSGPATAEIALTYYVNQAVDTKTALSTLEKSISAFLKQAKGVFQQRDVNLDFSGKQVVNYRISLSDFDLFNTAINKLYLQRMDAEFTAALEAKLSED